MRITSKGQVTIPKRVRDELNLEPANSRVEFVRDDDGRWYLHKVPAEGSASRFREAAAVARPRMSSEQLLKLTRDD